MSPPLRSAVICLFFFLPSLLAQSCPLAALHAHLDDVQADCCANARPPPPPPLDVTEDFEIAGWDDGNSIFAHTGTGAHDWVRINGGGGTPSSDTGPNTPHGGSAYIYTEASSNSDVDFILNFVPMFPAGQSVSVEIWYHMYGSNMGGLLLETAPGIDANAATGWTTAWSKTGEQQSSSSAPWVMDTATFRPTQDSVARIRGHTGTDFHSDMAIDDIHLMGGVMLSGGAPPPPPVGTATCAGGYPEAADTCSRECARSVKPFWDSCGTMLTTLNMAGTDGMAAFDATCAALPKCDFSLLFQHFRDVDSLCCAAGGSCRSGSPGSGDTCSMECATVFEPFWDDCGSALATMGMTTMGGAAEMTDFYGTCLETKYPPGSCTDFCSDSTLHCREMEMRTACCADPTNCPQDQSTPLTCPVGCALFFPSLLNDCQTALVSRHAIACHLPLLAFDVHISLL